MIEVIEDGTKKKYAMRCKWCNTMFSFTYYDTFKGMYFSNVICPVCKEDIVAVYSNEVTDESDKNDR